MDCSRIQNRSFPKPESMKGQDDAHAGFVYVQIEGAEPRFTIGRNVISQEVEEITSSSGDVFEQKLRDLKKEKQWQPNSYEYQRCKSCREPG